MQDIGHVPQLEAPEEYAAHMLAWLGEQLLRAAA
jgi:pimeloyl-ACP methyl ester carboxylesterase